MFNEEQPIFQQLAQQLEEGILSGDYPEESQVPSITEYSTVYKINPATALKGINLLVDAGLLYKKRGVGMFVSAGSAGKTARAAQRVLLSRLHRENGAGGQASGTDRRPDCRNAEEGI
jgi:DNA-binding transcriptional regulator YhcF (GntR family)